MNQTQLFGTVSTVLSALAIFLYIIFRVPAQPGDILVTTTLFVSFIVWLGGLLAAGLYYWRVKRGNGEVIYAHMKPSIRQGLLIAATIAALFLLQLLRVWSIWDTLLVILVAGFIEIGLQSHLGRKSLHG